MLKALKATELAPGLWRWTAWHPEWEQDVGCLALATGGGLVLVDPQVPEDDEEVWDDLGRAIGAASGTDIVLTVFYHDRSASAIRGRWPDVSIHAEASGIAHIEGIPTHLYRVGDSLPGGLVPLSTPREGEAILWDPASSSLIVGDVLLGKDGGVEICPAGWLPEGVERQDMATALTPMLDLPLQRILVSHGEPVLAKARAALQRAIVEAALG
jgi:glyoxylase-like metal-dependent hydrolase (beta-lactamase superfamily II)